MWQSRRGRGLAMVIAAGLDVLVWHGAVRTMGGDLVPSWVPVVVMVAGHQSLWLLGRHPRAVLATQVILGSASLVVPLWQPFAGLLLATYAVCARFGARRATPTLPAVGAVLLAHSYGSARLTAAPFGSTMTLFALWGVVASIAVILGVRAHSLATRNRQSAVVAQHRLDRELAAERRRIAHELHDGVGGTVTAVHLHAAAARELQAGPHSWSTDPAGGGLVGRAGGDSLAAIEAGAERTLVELRRLLASLTASGSVATADQPELGRPAEGGPRTGAHSTLMTEAAQLAASARGLGVVVALSGPWDEVDRLSDAMTTAVLRTLQEGLTNAVKHGGPDTTCVADLVLGTAGGLELTITSTPPRRSRSQHRRHHPSGYSGGHGLAGLQERASQLGGRVQVWPADDDVPEFRLRLQLPGLPVAV